MKPSDFSDTFSPTYIQIADEDPSLSQHAFLLFDRSKEDHEAYALKVDRQLLLSLAYDILQKYDPSPEYENLRTLKNIEKSVSKKP